MPRKPRPNVAGGIYHVYARGNNRARVFVDDRDRRAYLAILSDVVAEFGWVRLGYCLMENHVHLLIETPEPNLSRGMQRLQCRYTQRFNRRHRRTGHLFQGRFGAVLVTSDRHLATVTSYVARNPVEAGLCKSADSWAWTDCVEARKRCAAAAWVASHGARGARADGRTPD
jgi:REP element-mobilizing transposase RayT